MAHERNGAASSPDNDSGQARDRDRDDEFWLYDLKVEVVAGDRPMVCRHRVGDHFLVEGENLVFDQARSFPMYALAALLPLLPAKQRDTDENDWMSTDAEVACPDPHCGGRFRITRTGRRAFRHASTTGLPEHRGTPYWAQADDSSEKDSPP
ncbi:MAG: TIGR04076 family protein [Gammaproteobacteria bacterium]